MKAIALTVAGLLSAVALAAPGRIAGDPKRGEIAYQKCYSCHAVEPGRNDLTGPSLNAIVGRRVAAAPGFRYSPALVALARTRARWDRGLLDRFIADPETVAPGTEMSFTGMRNPSERADLIAYLETLRPSRP